MNSVEIGKNIRIQRKNKNLTQQELAERIGRTESSIRKYEKGLVQIPINVLEQIASVLEVSPYELMGFDYFDLKDNGELLRNVLDELNELEPQKLNSLSELVSLEKYITTLGYDIKPAFQGAVSGVSQEEAELIAMEADNDPHFPCWEVTTKEGNTFIVSLAEHKQLIKRVKSLIVTELKIIEESGYYAKEKKTPGVAAPKDL